MKLIVYELDNSNKPIPESVLAAWKGDTTHRIVIASEESLSYLQGIRDIIGLDCILIGSNGAEIQIGTACPISLGFQDIYDAVKWVRDSLAG